MCCGCEKRGPGEAIASNEALGRSRGGFGTKIHILCDGQGNPLGAVLSAGQEHESQYLETVLDA